MTVTSMLSLKAAVKRVCASSQDPFAKLLPDALPAFGELAGLCQSYEFKRLPDEAFDAMIREKPVEPGYCNRLLLSSLLRTVEAYQIVSLWRAVDLANGATNALNANLPVAASVGVRSLIELAVRYLVHANEIVHILSQYPWQSLDSHSVVPMRTISDGKTETLEAFVERLFWMTRLPERLKEHPQLQESSILSFIDKYDKASKAKGISISLRADYYDWLCELAHPNYVGNVIYLSEVSAQDKWDVWTLKRGAQGHAHNFILGKLCGAFFISVDGMGNGFNIIQECKANVVRKMGPLYPMPIPDLKK